MSKESVEFIELARQKEIEVPKRTYEEWSDMLVNIRLKNLQVLMPIEELESMLNDWASDSDELTDMVNEAQTELHGIKQEKEWVCGIDLAEILECPSCHGTGRAEIFRREKTDWIHLPEDEQ